MFPVKRLFAILILFLSFIIYFPQNVLAVTITINDFPATIDSQNSYQVNASVSGALNATNYLRVDLFKEGSTNYFGETYNGSDWYGGSEGKNYFPVQIQNSSASATLSFQLGNPSTTQYTGPGIYKLKIRRYTSSGSSSSNDSQILAELQINYVFPTPTPEPTPATIPTPTLNPTATPVKSPTPLPTKAPSPKPTPKEEVQALGLEDNFPSGFSSPDPTVSSSGSTTNDFPFFAVGLIGIGIIFVGFAAFSILKTMKRSYTIESEKEDSQIS